MADSNQPFIPAIENVFPALAGVAGWIECQCANRRVAGSIPGQGTCLGCGLRGNPSMFFSHIDVSLPLFLSSPVSKNKILKKKKEKTCFQLSFPHLEIPFSSLMYTVLRN